MKVDRPNGEKGYSASTISQHLTALKSLTDVANIIGIIPWTLRVKRPRVEAYTDTSGPGTERIAVVLDVLEKKTDPASVRDCAIITLLYEACLRRGDLVNLTLKDVDIEGRKLFLQRKKKWDKVMIPLHENGARRLAQWIEIRGKDPGPLFKSFDHNQRKPGLSGSSILRICHKHNLGRAHGLRHTGATDLLTISDGNVTAVMAVTGHIEPKTLMKYNDNRLKKDATLQNKLHEYRKQIAEKLKTREKNK